MKNLPNINLGIIAVSRDCFSVELSKTRRQKVAEECKAKKIPITEINAIVENEKDILIALEEIKKIAYKGHRNTTKREQLAALKLLLEVEKINMEQEKRALGLPDEVINVTQNVSIRQIRDDMIKEVKQEDGEALDL